MKNRHIHKNGSRPWRLLIFACTIIAAIWICDFSIKFEENGNSLSLIQFKIVPVDYVREYRFVENKLINKAVRSKNIIDLTYYNTAGKVEKRIRGDYNKYPIIRTTYHSNGNVLSHMPLKDTIRHGEQEIFDLNGRIIKTRLYKNDQLLKEVRIKNNQIEYYPYVEASMLKKENVIEFYFDVSHINIENHDTVKVHYDFAIDSTQYYRTRQLQIINTTEFTAKFRADSSMMKLKQIYGYIELDTVAYPGFAFNIKNILKLRNK